MERKYRYRVADKSLVETGSDRPVHVSLESIFFTRETPLVVEYRPVSDKRIHVDYVPVYKLVADAGLGSFYYDAGIDAVRLDSPFIDAIAQYLMIGGYADMTMSEYVEKLYGNIPERSSL